MAKQNQGKPSSGFETPGLSRSRPVIGSRSGEAVIAAVREDALALWDRGDLQSAGRDLVRGKIGLQAALDSAVGPGMKILDRALELQTEVADNEARADAQLGEALEARRTEKRARVMQRGGKNSTVVRGVVTGDDDGPLPGLVVEARRAGTKFKRVLAVDVTDAKGRFQLVVSNADLGSAKAPRVTLHAGLDRDRPVVESRTAIALKPGSYVEHSMVMPKESAARVRFALERREETDRARWTELASRAARRHVEGQLGAKLGEVLGAEFKSFRGRVGGPREAKGKKPSG